MSHDSISFQNISFTYDTASSPLFEELTVHFPAGWTGVVGANGTGKTTILKLATGELKPQRGHVQIPETATYCPQRTDEVPPMFANLIRATDGDAWKIKRRLDIADEWVQRWDSLSHGERKRAQIAVVLWGRPQVLAVDEPTNHLDIEARSLLAAALRSFRGIGLLVSHDRELLDTLCRQCLFVEPPEAVMRPGGYTQGSRQAMKEEEYIRKQYDIAKDVAGRLKREAVRRRDAASRARRRLSKRGLDPKDHDARDKINLARVTGKDGVDGKRLRQIDSRLRQARNKQEQYKVKKTYRMGIWL
ncbi:MAG: ABC-F family ATP-binding cassette domain-containing protein, partial [Candidatus Hydrogenedentota bacterium]